MKQTIVEWLEEEYLKLDANFHYSVISYEEFRIKRKELFTKVKAMEKEQIIKAFEIGYDNGACVQEGSAIYHGSNYYNETFKR